MTAQPIIAQDQLAEDWRAGGFALYVHWPFCAAKCPYCDFNSHVAASIDQPRWLNAYRSELARLGREVPGRVLNSIFFGGGTPSLMAPETVAGVIAAAREQWPFANDIEITLEANPTSIETGRFRAFADGGVNRVSMGMQALNDEDLRRLGRMHSVAEGRAAFDIARDCFTRVSFDLIYARQDQDRAHWRRELGEALSMAVDHLSAYQLTIEPGTAFGARHAKGGLKGLPDDDVSADMYQDTQEICAAAGMPNYEISNHARPGAESRHNLIYWRQGDWAAIGPGAHGRLTLPNGRWATEAHRAPGQWLEAVEARGNGDSARELLGLSDRAVEYLLMSLRLSEGMQVSRYLAHGARLPQDRLADLIGLGLVVQCDDRIAATEAGRPVLNGILRELAE